MIKYATQDFWQTVGFENTTSQDYLEKPVVLRDGRDAIVWVHKQTGHGILDSQYWEPSSFYDEDYRNEFGPEIGRSLEPSMHLQMYNQLNERQFRSFSSHLKKKTNFLEIGCSFGGILKRVSDSGVAACHAVEPNKKDALYVQNNIKHSRIINTTFQNADLPDNFYDMVVAIEVLEHCISPRKFLRKCRCVLQDEGLLHLEVPNHNEVLLNMYTDTSYDKFYYRKIHIHYFTEQSLQKLCRECGFQGNVSSFLMYPFFNHVWWHLNRGSQPSASSAFATPRPTKGNTPTEKAINDFYKSVQDKYENLINAYGIGDSLIFQGTKANLNTDT